MEKQERDLRSAARTVDTRTVIRKPSRTPVSTSYGRRAIFSPQVIEREAGEFNLAGPNLAKTDNPGLLAIRNQTAIFKTRRLAMSRNKSRTVHNFSLLGQQQQGQAKHLKGQAVLSIQKSIEQERDTISFSEDLITYFAKHKEGGGHRFIYLIYARDQSDPKFSPYELKKVPYAEIQPEYFTMSAGGVTRILPDGCTEQVSLETWIKESTNFESLRKLKTFSKYVFWKPFGIWKRFVMRRRYDQLTEWAVTHPCFHNRSFYQTALQIVGNSAEGMIKKYSLPFTTHGKLSVNELHQTIQRNREAMHCEYAKFLDDVVGKVLDLDTAIREPSRLVVKDEEFQEIRRINPNVTQMKVLEQKIYAEKIRRQEMVESEIQNIQLFIRMLSYNLTESMCQGCRQAWKIALETMSQDTAAVFRIDVSFSDDGNVTFSPVIEELLEALDFALDQSFEILESLPRLLMDSRVASPLGLKPQEIPKSSRFVDMISSDQTYEMIKKKLRELVVNSYRDANLFCQSYRDFYPIFDLNKTWNPARYAKPRGGDKPVYNLSELMGLYDDETEVVYDFSNEVVLNFQEIIDDMKQFRVDMKTVEQFRASTVKGCLYVDSRKLKETLTPIPSNSLNELKKFLQGTYDKKEELLRKIFRFCGKKLQSKITNLDEFVRFCDFSHMVKEMTPLICQEIDFLNALSNLIEESGFAGNDGMQSARNQLQQDLWLFKENQALGVKLLRDTKEQFEVLLQQKLYHKVQSLGKLKTIILSYPITIEHCRMDVLLPQIKQVKEKLLRMEPKIKMLRHYQQVMAIEAHDLSGFDETKEAAIFTEKLYHSVASYLFVKDQMCNMPFASVDMPRFLEDIRGLDASVTELVNANRPQNSLLVDLSGKTSEIRNFVDPLSQLADSKMTLRHWNQLFEECGQPNKYTPQVTIFELIQSGILSKADKVAAIASRALGETQMDTNFRNITRIWKEKQLPLLEKQVRRDDSLILGDTETLFQEIADTQTALQNMIQLPFVKGLEKEIKALSSELEHYALVIDAWLTFQSNWVILSSIFTKEEIANLDEEPAKKFQNVKRNWMSLIRHTLEDFSLSHICAFPSLLEMLNENNKALENILGLCGKYLEKKRRLLPRLYFLGNEELLTLLSTTNFEVFNRNLVKLFMHVSRLDIHSDEASDYEVTRKVGQIQNFSKLKVFSMVGDYGDTLMLTEQVPCTGSVEKWVANLIEVMKRTIRNHVYDSVQRYNSSPLNDWILAVPGYISLLTINALFTNDIDDCFRNYDSNQRVFANYEAAVIDKIHDLGKSLAAPLTPSDLMKVSSAVTLYNYQLSVIRSLSEKVPNFSQAMNWHSKLKTRFSPRSRAVTMEFGDEIYEHGYEFWGSPVQFIHTPASERVLLNVCASLARHEVPYVFSNSSIGKKHLIADLACHFGRYCYFKPNFNIDHGVFLQRVIQGAAAAGCWVVFHGLDKYSPKNSGILFDALHEFIQKKEDGKKEIYISGKSVPLLESSAVFVTGSRRMFEQKHFPHHLRGLLKPVGFAAPDTRLIAEIRLAALGFKTTKHIAKKLVVFMDSIESLYPELHANSTVFSISCVLNIACRFLHYMMHSKGVPFLSYYESVRMAEEYVVSRALFKYFSVRLCQRDYVSLLRVLYTYFPLFGNFEDFRKRVTDPCAFDASNVEDLLERALKDKLSSMSNHDRFVDYMVNRCMSLFRMMNQYQCIIICGKVNSGKTLVIDILKEVLADLLKKANGNQKLEQYLPIKVYDLFHMIESNKLMYGEAKESADGPVFLAGHLQSYARNLMLSWATHHVILRLNGPIDRKFLSFLSEVVGSDDTNVVKLNSMDAVAGTQNMHLFIETDSVPDLDLICVQKCGIFYMEAIIDPLIIFGEALRSYGKVIAPEKLEILSKTFCSMMPEVTQAVITSQNPIHCLASECKIPEGDGLIYNEFPHKVALLAFKLMDYDGADEYDEAMLRTTMVFAFFMVYSQILEPEHVLAFENWIRSTYSVEIPSDWVGANVPNHFWDVYPRPSLLSLRISKGKLIPIDFNPLSDGPIFVQRMGSMTLKLPSDVTVCTAQLLPALNEIKLLMQTKEHFMTVGPRSCGKSSLLRYAFQREKNIVPVVIPVTRNSTAASVQSFLERHTPIVAKSYTLPTTTSTFALIFDNVPPENKHIVEFIRMLTSIRTIPKISRKDPKFLDLLQVHSFFVIVTAASWNGFSARFLSEFYPIQLTKPEPKVMGHIIRSVGGSFDVAPTLMENVIAILNEFSQTKESSFNFLHILDCLCALENRSLAQEGDLVECAKCLISEMRFLFYHKLTSEAMRHKFEDVCLAQFPGKELGAVFRAVIHGESVVWPRINVPPDYSVCTVNMESNSMNSVMEEIRNGIVRFNQCREKGKLIMPVTRSLLNNYVLLARALSYPGRNILIRGGDRSGRSSLVKLVAQMREIELVSLPAYDRLLDSPNEDRRQIIQRLISHAIYSSVVASKSYLILIRLNRISKEDWVVLSRLCKFRDFYHFFDEVALEDLYFKFSQSRKIKPEQKLFIHQQISLSLWMRLRFVLVGDASFDIGTIPNVYTLDFSNPTFDVLGSFVTDIIMQDEYKDLRRHMTEKSLEIFPAVHRLIERQVPEVSLLQFQEFVQLFARHSSSRLANLTEKHRNIESAIAFLKALEKEINVAERRIKKMKPNLESRVFEAPIIESSMAERRAQLMESVMKTEEEERVKQAELNQLSEEIAPLKTSLTELSQRTELVIQQLNSLQDVNIGYLRQMKGNPPPAMKKLMEMILVLLDRPPQYEPYGEQLLDEPHLLALLKENISTSRIRGQILLKAKPVFQQAQFTKSDFDAVNRTVSVLYDWIETVYRYALVTEKLTEKTKEYEEKKGEVDKFLGESKVKKETAGRYLEDLDNEQKELDNSQQVHESMEREFHSIEARRRTLVNLFKGLDILEEKWIGELAEFESSKFLLIGNSLIFAMYIIYFGRLTLARTMEVFNQVFDELKTFGLHADYQDPIQYVVSELQLLTSSQNDTIRRNEPVLKDVELTSHILSVIPCTPLVFDPDGLVISRLVSRFHSSKIKVSSMLTKNLSTVMAKAMKKGVVLFLEDVNWLHPLIEDVLPYNVPRARTESDVIMIDGKRVDVHMGFRLILLTNRIDGLPKNLLEKTIVIDVSKNSLQSVEEVIGNTFVNFFEPEIIQRYYSVQQSEKQHELEIVQYERETLENICAIVKRQKSEKRYDYISDEQLLGKLLQAKECYYATLNVGTNMRSATSELKMAIEPFSRHIVLCKVFWEALSRYMPRVRTGYVFVFQKFLNLIQRAMQSCGFQQSAMSVVQQAALRDALISHILRHLFAIMSFKDAILFLFISGFLTQKAYGKSRDVDFEAVLEHISSEYDGRCDYTTIDIHNGDPLDQLKYSNIVNFFDFIARFAQEQFGKDVLNMLPVLQLDSLISPAPEIPVLIQVHGEKDPTRVIEDYISLREKPSEVVHVTICDDTDSIQFAKETVDQAVTSGKVVLIHVDNVTASVSACVCDILKSIKNPSPEFRLIFITPTMNGLANEVMTKFEKYQYEKFPSPRHVILEILQHHASSMVSDSKIVRKLSYAFSLLYSIIGFSQFIRVLGFSESMYLNEMSIKKMVLRLKDAVSMEIDIPMRNVRNSLVDIDFGCAVTDSYDDKKMRTYVSMLTTPDVLEDGFVFIEDQSIDASIYSIPNEMASVTNWFHHAERIAMFPNCDILCMNSVVSSPIRNWNMSRWISKPLLKLYKAPDEDESDVRAKIVSVLKTQLPARMMLPQPETASPLLLFLTCEVKIFNNTVLAIKGDLEEAFAGRNETVYHAIGQGKIPSRWNELLGYGGTKNCAKFFRIMKERRALYESWTTNGIMPKKIDVNWITDVKGLLRSYLIEIAMQRQSTADVMTYDFIFDDDPSDGHGIMLTNLYLVGGNWDFVAKKLIPPNSRTPSVSKLPNCFCCPVKAVAGSQHTFMCPLYKSMPTHELMLEKDRQCIDGELRNLQWHIPLETEMMDRHLITTGVCIVCHIPDNF